MKETPYKQGLAQGQWTEGQVQECGFASAKECLEHQEQVIRGLQDALPSLQNPVYAAWQAEFIEGLEKATRESLGRLAADS